MFPFFANYIWMFFLLFLYSVFMCFQCFFEGMFGLGFLRWFCKLGVTLEVFGLTSGSYGILRLFGSGRQIDVFMFSSCLFSAVALVFLVLPTWGCKISHVWPPKQGRPS